MIRRVPRLAVTGLILMAAATSEAADPVQKILVNEDARVLAETIMVGALVVQSLLIIGLLYQRRARQRAELESQRKLALAADADRRQTISALTSSMAHDLGQPLNSMMYNAQALQLMVTTNRATPETIEEILADIQSQGARAAEIIERHRGQ
jgi:signal transduction histidine kinase